MSEPRIVVTGYMLLSQFQPEELDESRESGLTEQVENDIIDDLGDDLDEITMVLVAGDDEDETDLDEDEELTEVEFQQGSQ